MFEEGSVNQENFQKIGQPGAAVRVQRDALRQGRIKEVSPADFGAAIYNLMQSERDDAVTVAGDASPVLTGQVSSSVRSGRHAQTLLESANTQMAEGLRMLEVGHERTAYLEAVTLHQVADFRSPYFQQYFDLARYLEIDLAIRDLIFDVALESKSSLPSTSLSGMYNWYVSNYDRGAITLEELLKKTGQWESAEEDWQKKVVEVSWNSIPGLPLTAQMEAQIAAGANLQNADCGCCWRR